MGRKIRSQCWGQDCEDQGDRVSFFLARTGNCGDSESRLNNLGVYFLFMVLDGWGSLRPSLGQWHRAWKRQVRGSGKKCKEAKSLKFPGVLGRKSILGLDFHTLRVAESLRFC